MALATTLRFETSSGKKSSMSKGQARQQERVRVRRSQIHLIQLCIWIHTLCIFFPQKDENIEAQEQLVKK